MKRIKLSILMTTLLLTIPIFSQKVTIQEATEMALRNNKSIKVQMLEVERSKLDVDSAWKKAYFSVNYTATAGRYFKDIAGSDQSYSHNITLSQPIYVGGAIKSGIKIGKESLDLAELTLVFGLLRVNLPMLLIFAHYYKY